MRIFLTAFALVCAALVPEAWSLIPSFRASVLHGIAWVGAYAPAWIFGLVVAAILLDFLVKNWRAGK